MNERIYNSRRRLYGSTSVWDILCSRHTVLMLTFTHISMRSPPSSSSSKSSSRSSFNRHWININALTVYTVWQDIQAQDALTAVFFVFFPVHDGWEQVHCLANAKTPCGCSVLCLRPKRSLCSCPRGPHYGRIVVFSPSSTVETS